MKQCACLFIRTAALLRAALVFIVIAACQSLAPTQSVATTPVTRSAEKTATPSPIPTITFTPSPTPTIAELIFPYTIEGLREHNFQGGSIHIRTILEETEKFTAYLIDYPSDGLTITGVM